MHKDRLIEISLVGIIVCGIAYSFIKHRFQANQDDNNDVITIVGDDIVSGLPSETAKPQALTKHKGRSITQHVSVESNDQVALPYVSYRLQSPFLPLGRLLDFRLLDGVLWFGGNTGLVGFDLSSKEWFIYDKRNGLPGDTAYDLEVVDGELIVEIKNWKDNRSLSNVGSYRFVNGKFVSLKGSIETAEAGIYVSSKLTGLPGRINDIIKHDGHTWVSLGGKHISREVGFRGGGVAKLTPAAELVRTYTQADGITQPYAYTMTAMQDGSLWLSHFHEERGLSVLRPDSPRWESVERSANDIELGGVRLGSIKQFLIIGQQRGLVFYDTVSRQAHLMKEAAGLPGYIVTGIQTVGETVWVSAYSYAKGGGRQHRSTGLIKFEYNDIAALFR